MLSLSFWSLALSVGISSPRGCNKDKAGMKGYIEIDQELCKGCEICTSFCPKDVISLSDKFNASGYQPVFFNDNGECTGCAACAVVCPEVAIEVYRG